MRVRKSSPTAINFLDMTADDVSSIQVLKRSYEAYISNESLSTGTLCLGRLVREIARYQIIGGLPLDLKSCSTRYSMNRRMLEASTSTSPLIYERAFWMTTTSWLPIFMILVGLKNIVALFLTLSVI